MPSRAFSQSYPDQPKPPPQMGQTQAVVQQGKAAIDQRRQAASYDQTGQQQALKDLYGQMQQTGSGYSSHPAPTSAYAQWQQQQGFGQPHTGPVSYGQTFAGSDYNGFKNEADMKASVSGAADMRRQAEVEQADALKQAMQAQLGQLDSHMKESAAQGSLTALMQAVQANAHIPDQSHQAGYFDHSTRMAGTSVSAPQESTNRIVAAQGRNTGEYLGKLNDWYTQQAEPRVQGMETANQIQNTPLYDYQRQAAGEMGVDPALAAGWFPQSGQIADAANQRNIQSLNTTGLPYSEQQQTLGQADTQAAADQKQMTADQQLQMIDDVYGATSYPGDKLATSASLPLDVVHQVTTDPSYGFDSYAKSVEDSMNKAQQDTANADPTTQSNAIQDAVDAAIQAVRDDYATTDPNTGEAIARILSAIYHA